MKKQERKRENAQKRFESVEKEICTLRELLCVSSDKQEKQSATMENPFFVKKLSPMLPVQNKMPCMSSSNEKPEKMLPSPAAENKTIILDREQGPPVNQSPVLAKMQLNAEEARERNENGFAPCTRQKSGPTFEEWTVLGKNAESLHEDEVSLDSSSAENSDDAIEEAAALHEGKSVNLIKL